MSDDQVSARAAQSRLDFNPDAPCRLVFCVDRSQREAPQFNEIINVITAMESADPNAQNWTSGDIFFGKGPFSGDLGFVFPGQGSQYVNMARDLMCIFPEALEAMEQFNHAFDPSIRDLQAQEKQLRSTNIAQPAIGTVSLAMFRVLSHFGVMPASVCGHSYGELTALLAAGWMQTEQFCQTSIARGRLMAEAGQNSHRPWPPDGRSGSKQRW